MKLSIVIPIHNEESAIVPLYREIMELINDLKDKEYLSKKDGAAEVEIILVDDCSTDGSKAIIEEIAKRDPRIVLVKFAQNAGHMAAISAGLKIAQGRWVATIDGDGQDPPKLISQMLEACHRDRAEVCVARRGNRRQDGLRHRIYSPIFYKLLNRATSGRIPIQGADFRLMSNRVVKALNDLPEREKIYRVLAVSLGFRSTEVMYNRRIRESGESKYKITKLFFLARDSFIATSGAPLRWLSSLLLIFAVIALVFSLLALALGFKGEGPEGWASLAVIISIFICIQSLTLAVICEYLLNTISIVRQRPKYQIEEKEISS
jgi:dolichol-phosphate mannosyltransferase